MRSVGGEIHPLFTHTTRAAGLAGLQSCSARGIAAKPSWHLPCPWLWAPCAAGRGTAPVGDAGAEVSGNNGPLSWSPEPKIGAALIPLASRAAGNIRQARPDCADKQHVGSGAGGWALRLLAAPLGSFSSSPLPPPPQQRAQIPQTATGHRRRAQPRSGTIKSLTPLFKRPRGGGRPGQLHGYKAVPALGTALQHSCLPGSSSALQWISPSTTP